MMAMDTKGTDLLERKLLNIQDKVALLDHVRRVHIQWSFSSIRSYCTTTHPSVTPLTCVTCNHHAGQSCILPGGHHLQDTRTPPQTSL